MHGLDGRMVGWMDACMGGWVERVMNGRIDKGAVVAFVMSELHLFHCLSTQVCRFWAELAGFRQSIALDILIFWIGMNEWRFKTY